MENSFLINVAIIAAIILAIGIPLLMYLNGNFTYEDRVYSKRQYKKQETNYMGTNTYYIEKIVIERRFDSGKIKYITKEVEI